jgi:hypothetical protein
MSEHITHYIQERCDGTCAENNYRYTRQTSEISRPKQRTEVLVTIDLANVSYKFLQTGYFYTIK